MNPIRSVLSDVHATMLLAQPEHLKSTPTAPDPEVHQERLRDVSAKLLSVSQDFAQLAKQFPGGAASRSTMLGARLMIEELGEVLAAMAEGDLVELADGLADLQIVTNWAALAHGIPLEEVHAEVHRSNMAKFPVCPTCRGSGKETLKLSAAASFFNGGDEDAVVQCEGCGGAGRLVIRDAGGKYLKPEGWTPPDVAAVLAQWSAK